MAVDDGNQSDRLWLPWLLVIWCLGLIWMASGFPFTGDDFFRVRAGSPAWYHVIPLARYLWIHTNGRVLGNLSSFLWVDHPIILAMIRGGMVTLIAILLGGITKIQSRWGWAVAMGGTLFLPVAVFREVYPWNAGFFNYVPPVMLILLAVWWFDNGGRQTTRGYAGLVGLGAALLGTSTALFMENMTLIAGCAGLWWVWRGRHHRSISVPYLVGVLAGGVLMFSSPIYRTALGGADSYRTIAGSLGALLHQLVTNYRILSIHLLHRNPLLVGLILLCIAWRLWSGKSTRWLLGLAGWGAGYFLVAAHLPQSWGLLSLSQPMKGAALMLDLLMLLALMLPVVLILWQDQNHKGMGFMAAAVVAAAPLLVVTPIGPRNAFSLHIFLLGMILTMISAQETGPVWGDLRLGTGMLAVVMVVTGYYGFMFSRIGETQRVQYHHIAAQMAQGATEIEIPEYPYPEWIYGPHGRKIEYLFCYEKPGDIQITFIPRQLWQGKWVDNGS